MNHARLLFAASTLCLFTPACDFSRAQAERALLEAEMMERPAMSAYREEAARVQDAQIAQAKADIKALDAALAHYARNNGGRYPDDLAVLVVADANGETYLGQKTLPTDPWDNAYAYEPPVVGRELPIVTCFGEDGVAGGEGLAADITSLDVIEEPK